MVGAALLILQRRCRGRGGRRPPRPSGGPANEVRCDGGAIRVCGRKLRLAGGKKEEQPP